MNRKHRVMMAVLVVGALWGSAGIGTQETMDDAVLLKRAGRAFSDVAKQAIPSVVFIQVEKMIQAGPGRPGPYFNDPFGLFGDEFLDRFFGGRGGMPPPSQQRQVMGQGTGFLISKDGYILTNNHVVGDADTITVKLHDGREMTAKRIGSDAKLKVFRNGREESVDVEIGTMAGEGAASAAAAEAAVELGMTVQDLTADLAQRFGYDFDEGVIIVEVEPGSMAFQAGLQPGFLITSVDGRGVKSTGEFNEALAKAKANGLVRFRVKSQRYSWYVVIRLT
jgi:S1-C subfamily serine protease